MMGFESQCGVPPCFLPEEVRERNFAVDLPDQELEAATRGFVKAPACAGCALQRRCFGVRAGYADMYRDRRGPPQSASRRRHRAAPAAAAAASRGTPAGTPRRRGFRRSRGGPRCRSAGAGRTRCTARYRAPPSISDASSRNVLPPGFATRRSRSAARQSTSESEAGTVQGGVCKDEMKSLRPARPSSTARSRNGITSRMRGTSARRRSSVEPSTDRSHR